MEPLRLFWAINLPADIKAKLVCLQVELKKVKPDVKWVEEENFHLTVKFLGDVKPDRVPMIIEHVKKEVLDAGNIRLSIKNLGVFPQRGQPRVLWAGVYGKKERLVTLHNNVQKALTPLGFIPDGKRFSPHLTLGRVRSHRGIEDLIKEITVLNKQNSTVGTVIIKTIDLMQSKLTRLGPEYSILESIKLIGGS